MKHEAPPTFLALDLDIRGTNLIEASAGTGKTWTIAALFLRLVLLEHMAVDKILVVTFTNAATAELKTRLRARLDDALRELQGLNDGDAALADLQAAYLPSKHHKAWFKEWSRLSSAACMFFSFTWP